MCWEEKMKESKRVECEENGRATEERRKGTGEGKKGGALCVWGGKKMEKNRRLECEGEDRATEERREGTGGLRGWRRKQEREGGGWGDVGKIMEDRKRKIGGKRELQVREWEREWRSVGKEKV